MKATSKRAIIKENKKLKLLLIIREIKAGEREQMTQAELAAELEVTERYTRELIRLLRLEGKIQTWNPGLLRDEQGRFIKVGTPNEEPHLIGAPLEYFFPRELLPQDKVGSIDGKLCRKPLGTEIQILSHQVVRSVPIGLTKHAKSLEPRKPEIHRLSSYDSDKVNNTSYMSYLSNYQEPNISSNNIYGGQPSTQTSASSYIETIPHGFFIDDTLPRRKEEIKPAERTPQEAALDRIRRLVFQIESCRKDVEEYACVDAELLLDLIPGFEKEIDRIAGEHGITAIPGDEFSKAKMESIRARTFAETQKKPEDFDDMSGPPLTKEEIEKLFG
jgi:hypothetical protein